MVKRLLILALAVLSLMSLVAPLSAQSLADVARKEEERRKAIRVPVPVLTNKDLGTVPAAPASAASVPAADGAAKDAAKDKTTAAEPARDQAYWSGKMKAAQTQLDRDQAYAVAMQVQVNALTTDFTNRDDPAQRAAIDQDRKKTMAELDRLTVAIQQDKKAVADLQEDARKAGVPPGWLR